MFELEISSVETIERERDLLSGDRILWEELSHHLNKLQPVHHFANAEVASMRSRGFVHQHMGTRNILHIDKPGDSIRARLPGALHVGDNEHVHRQVQRRLQRFT